MCLNTAQNIYFKVFLNTLINIAIQMLLCLPPSVTQEVAILFSSPATNFQLRRVIYHLKGLWEDNIPKSIPSVPLSSNE